jgi:AcrR family transcriptional regulator
MRPVRPPRQRRSEETLARFVGATRRLLGERPFDKITVNEIVQQAGSSVGAFYARFTDKDALLEYLRDVSASEAVAERQHQAPSRDWDAAPLEDVALELVRVLVKFHRTHAGTLRAVSARAIAEGRSRSGAGDAEISPHIAIAQVIKRRRGELAHPNPDVALHLGLRMVESAVRERVLFPELSTGSAPMSPITDAVFVEELARALIGFLGVYPKEPPR